MRSRFLKALVYHAISQFLEVANLAVTRLGFRISRVSGTEAKSLLDSLHPVQTGIDLIRLGAPGDGGYLVPDDLGGVSACFSPGVGDQASFERDLQSRGIRVHLADGNPRARWASKEFDFVGENVVSEQRNDGIHLTQWIRSRADVSSDLILQMDIEGHEWEILSELSRKELAQFRIIVIEFHQLSGLGSDLGLWFAKTVFQKLLSEFVVAHAHANLSAGTVVIGPRNSVPRNLELTFLRKDRIRVLGKRTQLPHELDEKNVCGGLGAGLPSVWSQKNNRTA